MIPKLELRVARVSSAAPAFYLDRYGDRWERREGLAVCVRCGRQALAPYRNLEKRGGYCRACVVLSARPRIRGPFPPAVEIDAGGLVQRCRRCRRPLEGDGARSRGYGHSCLGALATDGQLELVLGDRREVLER